MGEARKEVGPVYGAELIDRLPLPGGMCQALPSRLDLETVLASKVGGACRVVAGYEVALARMGELEGALRTAKRAMQKNIEYAMRKDEPALAKGIEAARAALGEEKGG